MSRFDEDIFLSDIFRKKCYQCVEINDVCALPDDCDFAYVKKVPDQLSALLASSGFTKIETTVDLSKEVNEIRTRKKETTTRLASTQDSEALKKLAKNLFVHDRWHKDPNIDNKVAQRIKERWIENYFSGNRGDFCIIQKYDDVIKGFLLLIKKSSGFKIDLIGVDPQFQGLGIGRQLIHEISHHTQEVSFELQVNTQVSNLQALNFYRSIAFKTQSQSETWHFHRKKISS